MKLNFRNFGSADTHLIIAHGLFGTLDNWVTLAKKYAENYKVWLIDLRNHGKSPHVDSMTYNDMVDDILDFIDQHQIATFCFMGHSMGGKVAMLFTEKYPERIEKLIIADIAPKAYLPKHNEIIDALCALPLKEIESRQDANTFLSARIDEESVVQFLLKNLSRDKDTMGFKWKMNLDEIVKYYPDIIGSVNLINVFDRPVLIIYGFKSNYINEEDFENFESIYSNVDFIGLDAGHWLHAEKQSEFFEETSQFLESI